MSCRVRRRSGFRSPLAALCALVLLGSTLVAPDIRRPAAATPPAASPGLSATPRTTDPLVGATPQRRAATATTELVCDEATLPAATSAVAEPGETVQLPHDASNLEIGPTVVTKSTVMQAKAVCAPSLPPLDQGMTNVTAGPRNGYRYGPNGKYRSNMKLSLPYDPALIPGGLTDQDVLTYYYDTQSLSWRALPRISVDGNTQTVHSLTDHFTDFINATVTVPDHPETFTHNPNSLKDIKAADPSASVNLVDAPKANYSGTARLTYPIEVPPGRNGLTPQVALSYDSGAINGWLGVGWSMGMPSVTIDTRWGVPRYSTAQETETYTLNGDQLSPVAHRGALQARTAEKVFHARVEGTFRRIVRHGGSPSTYWW